MDAWDLDAAASPGWRLAFEEAWDSFRAGNFGVGAVLVDPDRNDEIVSIGRNRVAQQDPDLRTLSGNMIAHAEMNAFAALDRFNADGLHLYTTLEPCLMCAGTAMQLKVAHVHYASADEFYDGMDELWPKFAVTADRQPTSTGPLSPPLANFARLLPMMFTLQHFPGRSAEQLARARHPQLATVADRLGTDEAFSELKRTGSVDDAVAHLWPELKTVDPG